MHYKKKLRETGGIHPSKQKIGFSTPCLHPSVFCLQKFDFVISYSFWPLCPKYPLTSRTLREILTSLSKYFFITRFLNCIGCFNKQLNNYKSRKNLVTIVAAKNQNKIFPFLTKRTMLLQAFMLL